MGFSQGNNRVLWRTPHIVKNERADNWMIVLFVHVRAAFQANGKGVGRCLALSQSNASQVSYPLNSQLQDCTGRRQRRWNSDQNYWWLAKISTQSHQPASPPHWQHNVKRTTVYRCSWDSLIWLLLVCVVDFFKTFTRSRIIWLHFFFKLRGSSPALATWILHKKMNGFHVHCLPSPLLICPCARCQHTQEWRGLILGSTLFFYLKKL